LASHRRRRPLALGVPAQRRNADIKARVHERTRCTRCPPSAIEQVERGEVRHTEETFGALASLAEAVDDAAVEQLNRATRKTNLRRVVDAYEELPWQRASCRSGRGQ